ncbi:MAG: glycosyltransferase family 2 protein [Bacteroidia bacterium]|nr:glycosyltransferase family 2 protein [Bacteroidia bacterium]
MHILFWFFLIIVIYSFIGYGLIMMLLAFIKSCISGKTKTSLLLPGNEIEVTLLIAAYNEKDYIEAKVKNIVELNYPVEKLHCLWVTDGSDDGTPELLARHSNLTILHEPERKGKIAAINRAMKYVKTPIVIYSDCNSMLSPETVRIIVGLFTDPKVGCVSGEKRIYSGVKESASAAGEGFYWNYESMIKRSEAIVYSAIGAAGELFAIRMDLFSDIEEDTILDDFIISMRIAMAGNRIQYSTSAYAYETASLNIREEMVRKIRISAGAFQSLSRLKGILNPFKYGMLSFEYFSHKFLRWVVAPFSLLLLFLTTIIVVVNTNFNLDFYLIFLILQVMFLLFAFAGWILENYKLKFKLFFLPYYFIVMNFSVYEGLIRFLSGKHTVNWQKAKRS